VGPAFPAIPAASSADGSLALLKLASVRIAGGEPSDETAFWKHGSADRVAVASGGIAEAVAGEIDPESRGDGEVSDKTGQEGRGQQFRDSHWHSRDPVPSPGPGQREYLCAGVPKGGYSVGLLGAKTEIPG